MELCNILLIDLPFSFHYIIVTGGPNPVKGDLLVIAGSTLYAVSNVGEVCFFTSYPLHYIFLLIL